MFLSNPPENAEVKAFYEEAEAEDGYVTNATRVWAWRPDVDDAFLEARKLLASETTLTKREIAVLNVATASRRNDSYCAIAWGTRLAELVGDETACALIDGRATPALTNREGALASWAQVVARDPTSAAQEDVDSLRAAGFSEREIVDATLFVAFRVAFTTVNSALGAQPDRRLADEAPTAVLESVRFGRAIGT